MGHGTVKKHKSIGRRLIINTLIIISVILVALNVTFAVSMHNYYYERVSQTVSKVASSYSRSSVTSKSEFETQSFTLAQEFPYKTRFEVQFLNQTGDVIVSTSGYLPSGDDYYLAMPAEDGSGKIWTGKLSTGERVMAYASPVINYSGDVAGTVRCITSLEQIDRWLLIINIIVLSISLAFAGISVLLCNIYVQSITRPISQVNEAAHRIAAGDFKSRIEVHELNEIGELCDSINYMASELQSTDDMKNEFISSVSHELRTPLTAIRGWGETVRGSVYTDHALVEKGIGIILSESERLTGLVEELLDFSRIQSGRMIFKMERIDLLAELGEAVCMYEEVAKKAGVMLAYHEPDDVWYVIGDSNRLMQVFINVIDNAIKYNHDGGVVVIDAKSENGAVNVTVKDTGCGIPAEDIDKVKQKFYKANKTVRGSGIGLAVADEIIKQHNGQLMIESTPDIGTTVTVSVPIAEPDQAQTADITKEETNG